MKPENILLDRDGHMKLTEFIKLLFIYFILVLDYPNLDFKKNVYLLNQGSLLTNQKNRNNHKI